MICDGPLAFGSHHPTALPRTVVALRLYAASSVETWFSYAPPVFGNAARPRVNVPRFSAGPASWMPVYRASMYAVAPVDCVPLSAPQYHWNKPLYGSCRPLT